MSRDAARSTPNKAAFMMSPGMNKESMLAFIEADIKFEMKTKRRETRRANEAALQRLQQDAATVVQQSDRRWRNR